jgi:hypothetical protein
LAKKIGERSSDDVSYQFLSARMGNACPPICKKCFIVFLKKYDGGALQSDGLTSANTRLRKNVLDGFIVTWG